MSEAAITTVTPDASERSGSPPGPAVPRLGGFCKAYPAFRFREFPGWSGNARGEFAGDHMLYLQEDFIVTDGVYRDERIVFDAVCDEWRRFCRERLAFRMPGAATLVPSNEALPD